MSISTAPLYRSLAHFCYAAYGLDVSRKSRWIHETLAWPAEKRAAWRLKKLCDTLQFAWDHVPFYREYWGDHGVTFKQLRHLEELQAYPPLAKALFRVNYARIRPAEGVRPRYIAKSTGGTTGVPIQYLLDTQQWSLMQAFHFWGWSRTGWEPGEPAAIMAGGSLIPERVTLKERLRYFVERKMFLFGVHMNADLAREYHSRLLKFGAKVLYGYPSVIYVFGKHLAEQNLALPALKAVITTAEMLQPLYRQGIEKNLGCPVFDDVGCNDGGFEAYQCARHDGFHYNDLQAVLEVFNPDAEGKGTLLITNLWNKSTPFIRYENGDIVSLAKTPCPCGAAFPTISSIQGRTCDILTFRNGSTFVCAPHIFGELAIDGWQVVQTSVDRVEVRLCSASTLRPGDVDHVNRVFRYHLPPEVEL